jgi:ubiquinone biosynthesis protein Coq4
MVEMWRAFRSGAPLGDVALMKFAALTKSNPALDAKLLHLEHFAPKHDLVALRKMPVGSLGRIYARFLDDNGITPLEISPAMLARFADHPYAVRTTVTHDLHHVLTGFDAGLAGEVGVAAFMLGQGASTLGRYLKNSLRIVPLISPLQASRIRHNQKLGERLGARAKLLIAEPLEDFFPEPIDVVRTRLGLPDPRVAGVLPSGKSAYVKLIYAMGKRGFTDGAAAA